MDAPLAQSPANFGHKHCFFGNLVPNPSCVPNLKLLASMVAKIRRGSQLFSDVPLAQTPSNLGLKMAVLTYKVLRGCAPSYLGPFVRVADLPIRRALRSANTSRLIQPQSNWSTVGESLSCCWSPGLEQSATGGHISAITGHLSQASEDSSVHRVIFEHTTIVTD